MDRGPSTQITHTRAKTGGGWARRNQAYIRHHDRSHADRQYKGDDISPACEHPAYSPRDQGPPTRHEPLPYHPW